MTIFKTSKQLYSHFLDDIQWKLPDTIFIATYGLWGGINNKGDFVARCNSYRLLNYLNDKSEMCDTTIIVGYDHQLSDVIIETAHRFENIRFVAVRNFHTKCIITSTGILSIGSSNLTDSEWDEINSYTVVNVEDPEYREILEHLKLVAFLNYNITKQTYPKVDISDIVGSFRG